MPAFDTALTGYQSTPSSTSVATVFTSSHDASVLIDIVNVTTSTGRVWAGLMVSGSTIMHWKVFGRGLSTGDSLLGLGPFFMKTGGTVKVKTNTSNAYQFSVTGVRSSTG